MFLCQYGLLELANNRATILKLGYGEIGGWGGCIPEGVKQGQHKTKSGSEALDKSLFQAGVGVKGAQELWLMTVLMI